jgi:hypothetical protein
MAMASGVFGTTFEDSMDATGGALNLDADSVKYALYTDTRTPNFNTETGYTSTNEVSGTGYTAGGNALDSPTWATSAGFLTYDTADEQWTSATISSIRGAYGYDDTVTTPTADALLWAVTFGADFSVTAGTLTVQIDANGHFRLDITP